MIETACVNKDLLMGPLRFSTGQFPHVGFFFLVCLVTAAAINELHLCQIRGSAISSQKYCFSACTAHMARLGFIYWLWY